MEQCYVGTPRPFARKELNLGEWFSERLYGEALDAHSIVWQEGVQRRRGALAPRLWLRRRDTAGQYDPGDPRGGHLGGTGRQRRECNRPAEDAYRPRQLKSVSGARN